MTVRVLHAIAPGPSGGAETVVESLASAQAAAGQEVGVVASYCRDEPVPALVERARARPFEFHEVVAPHRSYLAEVRGLYRAIADFGPNLVHTHGYRCDVLGRVAAGIAGIPAVSTVHGFTGGEPKNRLFERLQLAAIRFCARVIAVSQPLASELGRRGVGAGRIRTIPNAWTRDVEHLERREAREQLGLPPRVPIVGWVGRISREKGLDLAVRALPRAPGEARLAVVGGGSAKKRVGSLAGELGVADRIYWCGQVPDAAPLYPAFDVFLLSSRTEGLPMVVFEAMAAGVPVVAADVGGVSEQITPDTGYLTAPRDPDALAEGIGNALRHPEEAARKVEAAGRRLEEHFGAEAWVADHRALYREIVEERRGAQ